eukprot:TRINITY_DN3998_c0_g1_i1.p1 TRINITY_DN3998_c0_g1~~TRINITY_DN3998_c0_g1_i1.p1  ORF type:complete len:351 (+),score=50.13 TRINITY_DN3998_c0_g1_i1:376-1428(+)
MPPKIVVAIPPREEEAPSDSVPLGSLFARGEIQFNDLEYLGDLGEGASGTVNKMFHKPTGTVMAVKKIAMGTVESKAKEIMRELSTMLDCDCEDLIHFHGSFMDDETQTISICLEFMDVGSLLDCLHAAGPFPENILRHIVRGVLRGLNYLHHMRHSIHRDLKPANLLINSSGKVKISDFGVCGEVADTLASTKTFIGTVNFMAPERLLGKKYTSSVDIWSLGLTIIQCATGRFPYEDLLQERKSKEALGFWQLVQLIDKHDPPTLPAEQFSADMNDFVSRCLVKDGSLRASAEELSAHPWVAGLDDSTAQQEFTRWFAGVAQKVKHNEEKKEPEEASSSTADLLDKMGF